MKRFAQEIIDALQGTCDTLSGAVQEVTGNDDLDDMSLSTEQHEAIDNQIFLCDECNWWCEISEANENPQGGGDICDDCSDLEDD